MSDTPDNPNTVSAGQIILGIDSIAVSGPALFATASSADYLGRAPQFWGRYFHAPGQLNAAGKKDTHYSPAEHAFLRAHNIRVLPVARQTAFVGQSAVRGDADARTNVAAIFEAFPPAYLSGADPDLLVFLDVEQQTPLSREYYVAWSAALIDEAAKQSNNRVRLHPAIYGSRSAEATWTTLAAAVGAGAVCDAVWIARYFFPGPQPRPWQDNLVTPTVTLPSPIFAWQYWSSPDDAPESANFDANLANAPHADMLLSRLVMPPPG